MECVQKNNNSETAKDSADSADSGSRPSAGSGRRKVFDWRADLEASRNLSVGEKQGFGFVVGWLEEWRVRRGLEPGRETARAFWKDQVRAKDREEWQLEQLEQWAEGIRWYLGWLAACEEQGGDGRSQSGGADAAGGGSGRGTSRSGATHPEDLRRMGGALRDVGRHGGASAGWKSR